MLAREGEAWDVPKPTSGAESRPRPSLLSQCYLQMFQQGRLTVLPIYGPDLPPEGAIPIEKSPAATKSPAVRAAETAVFSTPATKKRKLNVDFQAVTRAVLGTAQLDGVTSQVRHNEAQAIVKRWLASEDTTEETSCEIFFAMC